MRVLLALAALALAFPARAQTPDTDILAGRLVRAGGALRIDGLVNLTARPGYDNQPHFTRDGKAVLYTRAADGQTDIWRHDLATGAAAALTRTAESEYSATPLARGGFAVIRVEADSTQRLWAFDDAGANPRLLLDDVMPVGYQAWLDDSTVALFILGDPATLRTAQPGRSGASPIAADIGRALQKVPGRRAVSFVQRRDGANWIALHEPGAREPVRLLARLPSDTVPAPDGTTREVAGEYHAWLADGTLLATAGGRVFALAPGRTEWQRVADFGERGWLLSRIAVDPREERIALVIETR